MKRVLVSIAAGAFALLAVLGSGTAALASDASSRLRTDTNDFVFESFSADYYLDTDADGRSILTTVETFVAIFPDFDQNRGMRRAIPEDYQGVPTDVQVVSVTDGAGNPRPYELESEDGFTLVTSRADDYVRGAQTYVFTYTQKNVTRFFADTNDDEFYWDTNGVGWAQPFGSVSVRVHVPTELASSLTGQNARYQGYAASTTPCSGITVSDEPDGTVLSASAENLQPYQNLTIAIGFEPHTFVPRDDSYLASPVSFLQIFSGLAAVGAAVWGIILRFTTLADGRGRPTIIAEYAPPKDLDLFEAAVILGKTKRAAAAQFVDFAVRRRIRIVEQERLGFLSTSKVYLLELIDASGLSGPALNLAQALFGYSLQPGTGYLMTSTDTILSKHVQAIVKTATADATRNGLRKKGTARFAILPFLLAILGAIGTFVFGVTMLDDSIGGAIPLLVFIPVIIAVLVVFGTIFRVPLTDKGAELRDHLKGLELYIKLAEQDRLRMLQAPSTAEREAISSTDPRQVVDVYEKLLPYAVLFGLEKQWAEELGRYYVDNPPDYYSGSTAFNAAVFASSISSMSSTAASSYSGSSSSSSSGGSGGGGSSGGGGGGGGGGGV